MRISKPSARGKVSRLCLLIFRLFCAAGLFVLTSERLLALPGTLGDLNGDGIVDVRDLVLLQNHLNGVSILSSSVLPLADLNDDGSVTSSDVEPLINLILGVPLNITPRPVTLDPPTGSTAVGLTVRPKAMFPKPIDTSTLNSNNFYASFTGQKLPATIVPSSDGTWAWLFLNPPMPNAAQVQVTVDGSTIKTRLGLAVDAAGNGTPGSVATFNFSTVSVAPLSNTYLVGRIVDPGPDLAPRTADDYFPDPSGDPALAHYLLPIRNAKVYILGFETNTVYTDVNGRFSLNPVPVGDVKVVIDGRTAISPPSGYYFPEMVIDSTNTPGLMNFVMPPLDTMYLPRVASNVLQTVSTTSNTVITLNSNAAYTLSPTQQQYLTITVAPNSLINANGQVMSGGQVGIAVVPPELVADMLPPGLLQHTFDITIQAPGVATFTVPAQMTFPNVFNAPPGTELCFLSFDHTTGRLVIEGTATVSANGLYVVTDPGTGVTHPGWHGLAPPGTVGGGDDAYSGDWDPDEDSGSGIGPGGTLGTNSPPQNPTVPPIGPPPPAPPVSGGPVGGCTNFVPFTVVGARPPMASPVSLDGGYTVRVTDFGTGLGQLVVSRVVDGAPIITVQIAMQALVWGFGSKTAAGVPFAYAYWQASSRQLTVVLHNLSNPQRQVKSWTTTEPVNSYGMGFSPSGSYFVLAWNLIRTPNNASLNVIDTQNGNAFDVQLSINNGIPPIGTTIGSAYWGFSASEQSFLYGYISQPGTLTFGLINTPLMRRLMDRSIPVPVHGDVAFSHAGDLLGVLYDNTATEASLYKTCDAALWMAHDFPLVSSSTYLLGVSDGNYVVAEDSSCQIIAPVPTSPVSCPPAASQPPRFELSGGTHYVATVDLLTGQLLARGRAEISGVVESQIFLPANHPVRRFLYKAATREVAIADFTTPDSGARFTLPSFYLHADHSPDSDGDGLTDFAEFILGTDPARWSTAGDGISDGEKIAQGLNPLGSGGLVTGPVAALPLPGEANEVTTATSPTDRSQQTAYVACGSRGLSIVNVSQFQSPVLLGQLDLPGNATDVAVDPAIQIAVVAANSGGLHFVDVSNPLQPQLIRSINTNANHVRIIGPTVYASVGSMVVAYDLLTGQLLQNLIFGSASITGLAAEGFFLYTMDTANLLRVIDTSGDVMLARGSLSLSAGGGKLFVGNGTAYIPAASYMYGGFLTVSVSNPDSPVLIANSLGTSSTASPGPNIAVNGSGLALLAVTGGFGVSPGLQVYNVRNPTNSAAFVTLYGLPAPPSSVAIGGGIGFVADGTAGLQVINYQSFDSLGVPPTITLSNSFTMTSPTNGIATEGSLARVQAATMDDVQVRNVEFYIDGTLALSDQSFPFEYLFVTPAITTNKTNFTLQARAFDTGGNSTWSSLINVQLAPDTSPPRIRRLFPSASNIVDTTTTNLYVYFNKPINSLTLNSGTFSITCAGPDHRLDTPDDFLITNTVVSYFSTLNAGVLFLSTPLAYGLYRATLSTNVTDAAGNSLTNAISWTFWVLAGGADGDDDNDGLTNALEIAIGTDPLKPDTDGDNWSDKDEYDEGTNPLDPNNHPKFTVLACPPIQISLPSPETFGTAGAAVFVARPPIQIDLLSPESFGIAGAPTYLARPPIQINLPGPDTFGIAGAATYVARPPLQIDLLSPDSFGTGGATVYLAMPPVQIGMQSPETFGTAGSVAFVAHPPLQIDLPSADSFGGARAAAFVAFPRLQIWMQGPETFGTAGVSTSIAQPPVSISFTNSRAPVGSPSMTLNHQQFYETK